MTLRLCREELGEAKEKWEAASCPVSSGTGAPPGGWGPPPSSTESQDESQECWFCAQTSAARPFLRLQVPRSGCEQGAPGALNRPKQSTVDAADLCWRAGVGWTRMGCDSGGLCPHGHSQPWCL